MPKIVQKQEVLNGRGTVVLYGSGSSAGKWFYRQWQPTQKKYLLRQIPDAVSLEDAVNKCIDVAFRVNEQVHPLTLTDAETRLGGSTRRLKSSGGTNTLRTNQNASQRHISVKQAVESFLLEHHDRAVAGLIDMETHKNIARIFRQHISGYLEEQSVTHTGEIDTTTFDNYLIYRSKTTALQRSQELKHIKHWVRAYLMKHGYVSPSIALDSHFLPKQRVTEADRLKNPAIHADDWRTIINYVRDEWRHQVKHNVNQRYWYWRNCVWHYLLFSKNTGMSPEEIVKLKWKQIDIVDEGRINSKGEQESWEVAYISTIRSKTKQPREIPANQARELRRWKQFVLDTCHQYDLPLPTKDTEVFGNPFPRSGSPEGWRPYNRSCFSGSWREIREAVKDKLSGHRYSPHPYTLYSLRATFIEDHLLKGTPVIEVARMAGHNVVETQRSYERLDLRRKGFEITSPKFGEGHTNKKVSEQLF